MKKLVLLLLALLPLSAFAQNSRIDGVVFSRNGFPLPGATIAVCTQTAITAATESVSTVTITSTLNPPQGSTVTIVGVTPTAYNGSYVVLTTSGSSFTYTNPTQGLGAGSVFGSAFVSSSTPCAPLASLCASYTDTTCTSPNPVTGDGLGNYSFYVKPGHYVTQFYGSGLTARVQPDQILACDPSTSCTITGPLLLADGTAAAPTYSFSSQAGTGMFRGAGSHPTFTASGTSGLAIGNGAIVPSGAVYDWSSTADPNGTADSGFSRTAAATVALGTGTPGDKTGTLQLAAIQGPGFQKQIFTNSGTFTIPAGITQVRFTVIGGGGAGGGGSNGPGSGAGGAAGAVAVKWLTGLTPGNTITVTVGPGGTGSSAANGPGGTASSIASGTQSISTVTANGGGGGAFSTAAGGSIGPNGGTASGGDMNLQGGAGNTTYNASNGSVGGGNLLGYGGGGNIGGAGGNGTGFGGGGGGAGSGAGNVAGGNGAGGAVIAEWVN